MITRFSDVNSFDDAWELIEHLRDPRTESSYALDHDKFRDTMKKIVHQYSKSSNDEILKIAVGASYVLLILEGLAA